ncbi:glycerol-3-phosphate dehydrogenase [Sulfolobales archaeon HS-7]|nr:glycerol-3-phosphate dehydrogenase [Sulfolobales archaeon HS-7]
MILDPDNPRFYDSKSLLKEFVRQSTVCHGCRRCFNYCDSFPTLFKKTDEKGPGALTLEDVEEVASKCFHCNMCFVNCPYTPPHEFSMDFPRILEWGWLYFRTVKGVPLKESLMSLTDGIPLIRKLGKVGREAYKVLSGYAGVQEDAPQLEISERGFLEEFRENDVSNPVAKVVLFHTCLVENFFPEIGKDLVEVYTKLGIKVVAANFKCCGAPFLDSGNAWGLKRNAEHNAKLIREFVNKGYDVVCPIPTCTLMVTKEYSHLLKDVPKVYDAMEFLLKLKKEGKVNIKGEKPLKALYHPPCHLRYLGVGQPGVQLLRGVKVEVERVDKGCSGIDGGWGLRHYDTAKRVGKGMMDAFKDGKADVFVTECPLAGMQITKATGVKPKHPISLLKEAL